MVFFIGVVLFIKIILIINSLPNCVNDRQFCKHCDAFTDLCAICEFPDILIPDETGKCIGAKKCFPEKNYCLKCDEEKKFCQKCEANYYSDENGGCTYSEGCEISYKGECLKCQDDFYLIGNEEGLKFCKSKYLENFKNCKEIDYHKGLCRACNEGFNMTSGDHKCIKMEHCREAILGNCVVCDEKYYFNKKEDKCVQKPYNFYYCKQSLDGENCEVCEDNYYQDENGICIDTNYCSESQYYRCQKCKKGYFLSNNNICTNTEKCDFADRFSNMCNICEKGYYLNIKNGKCISNLEDGPFKYCTKSDENICLDCELDYYLGEDFKCSNSENCTESENGICNICNKDYHLGLDNICSNVEYCINSFNHSCSECEDGYYYSTLNNTCFEVNEKYLNCKHTCRSEEDKCCECKLHYYLNQTDSLCYENTEDEKYYKCVSVDTTNKCDKCENGYYLGTEDKKCSKIEHCKVTENINKCFECDTYFCLDVKKQECVDNDLLDDIINDKKYIACNRTNKEGTECEICLNGYEVNDEGYCEDVTFCEEKEDGKCIKCKDVLSENSLSFCANEVFGCLESYRDNCLKCNNLEDLFECTECKEGYNKTSNGCIRFNK